MELTEKAEEILESLWIQAEEEKHPSVPLKQIEVAEKAPVEQLLEASYVSLSNGNISLTSRGRPFARNVVRRHRLAERLLVDVLGAADRQMHEKACKFEHILDRGLDESICSLLGHPKVCPHGKPIPPGRCCRQRPAQTRQLVAPLSQLVQGQKGKVAYIYAPESNQLQKLVAMGVLPGAPINLIQSFPSYVFQMHQTQFAVDKEIADAIYVRLMEDEPAAGTEEPPSRHRWGWGKFRPRLRRGHPEMRQKA
jgi:DtxR family Mn-dependent transcriptional regulator